MGLTSIIFFVNYIINSCYPIESNLHTNLALDPVGMLYVATDRGNLYAFNPDGSLFWQYRISGGISFPPAIGADGTIYIGADNGYLYALDQHSKLIWCRNIGLRITSPIIIGSNALYVISDYRRLYSINLDGTYNWSQDIDGWVSNPPALGMDGKVYVGTDEGNLYAFNPGGNWEWNDSLNSRIITPPAVSINNTVYVATDGGVLCALGPKGRVLWHYRIGYSRTSGPIIGSNGLVYIGSDDGNLYALSPDGKLRFKVHTGFWPSQAPIVEPARIIYGKPPVIYILNPDGTFIDFISIPTPEELFSLKVNGNRFYANSAHYLWTFEISDTLLPLPDSILPPTVSNKADKEHMKPQLNIVGFDITYELSEARRINIKIYDSLGRSVKIVYGGEKRAGLHRFSLNMLSLPRGMYFLRLETGSYRLTKKLVIL